MSASDIERPDSIADYPELALLRAFALEHRELETFVIAVLSKPLGEIHFQRNREGDQQMGSIGQLVSIDQATFAQWLLPRFSYLTAQGYTTSEKYLLQHPDDAIYIHYGNLRQVRTRSEIEHYLWERILKGWALPASLAGGFRTLSDSAVPFDLAQFHAAVWGLPQPLPLSAPARRRRKRL